MTSSAAAAARLEGFLGGLVLATAAAWGACYLFSRRPSKGAFSTKDRTLFYGGTEEDLAVVPPGAKFLPNDLYGQAVRLLPILCIDICVERKSDGKFLLVKRGTEPVKGYWWVPGGRILRGETFFAAAVRKSREECGVKAVTPKKVLGVWNTFFSTSAWGGGTHTVNVGVHVVITDDDGADVTLDETSSGYKWISRSEVGQYDGYIQELVHAIDN